MAVPELAAEGQAAPGAYANGTLNGEARASAPSEKKKSRESERRRRRRKQKKNVDASALVSGGGREESGDEDESKEIGGLPKVCHDSGFSECSACSPLFIARVLEILKKFTHSKVVKSLYLILLLSFPSPRPSNPEDFTASLYIWY